MSHTRQEENHRAWECVVNPTRQREPCGTGQVTGLTLDFWQFMRENYQSHDRSDGQSRKGETFPSGHSEDPCKFSGLCSQPYPP